MIKTLQRHGNSQALVLDKPILEMLGARGRHPAATLGVRRLADRDARNTGVGRGEIDRMFEDLQPRYGDMLRRLAE